VGSWRNLKHIRHAQLAHRPATNVAHTEWHAQRKLGTFGPAGPAVSILTGKTLPLNLPQAGDAICIILGADRSPTGERQVLNFPDLAAAHRAGFTWAI
jgi:hypothetical protein